MTGLSAAEARAIQEAHRLDPLPENWFHDGSSYVDANNEGMRSDRHPHWARFAEEWVEAANAEAAARAQAAAPLRCVAAVDL